MARPTVPLTKAQLQTREGMELLALCQTVTEDGSIADDEIAALREWLERNRASDLPSVAFLVAAVERILADGRVDEWERRELHKALERVLPKEQRERAVEARNEAETRARMNDPRAFFTPWRVGGIFDFMVAGVRHEGRAAVVAEHVSEGDLAYFVRDRDNGYSRNATEVRIANGLMVGFVPEEWATQLAPQLDQGLKYHAWFKKVLTGGRFPIPVVTGELLLADAGIPVALREGELPGGLAVVAPGELTARSADSVPGSRASLWALGLLLALGVFIVAVVALSR